MIDLQAIIRSTQPAYLLGYWPLDGDATDKSGNGYDGSDTAVTWRPGGPPRNGYADLENPVTSIIQLGSSFMSAFDAAGGGAAGTLIAGVAMDWTFATSNNPLFELYVDANNYIRLNKKNADGELSFIYAAGGTTKSVTLTGLSGSDFYWFAMTWDAAADEFKAYVSGAQTGSTQTSLGAWAGSLSYASTNYIGVLGVGEPNQIDELAIWTVALSDDEVSAIYDALTATVTTTGLTEYKIRLIDTNGDLQYEVTDFIALDYEKTVNEIAPASFEVGGEHSIIDNIADMWEIEVWRRNQAQAIDWYRDWSGFYRQSERTGTNPGRFIAVCISDLYLLARRIVAWTAGTANRSKFSSVVAETIMKTLVDYNAGSNATTGNGRERTGTITGISVEADAAGGNTLDWYCAWQNLLTTLQELAEVAGGDFDLVKTGAGAWEFRFYSGQLGTDRSASVTFAVGYDNMANPHFRDERLNEKTVAIVGGSGTGGSRDIEIRTGSNYSAANDIEIFVDARDVDASDTAALQDRGDARLSELEASDLFEFEVQQTAALAYGKDYFLGDIVSVLSPFSGSSEDHQIKSVRVSVDSNGERIQIGLGGPILTGEALLVDQIKKLREQSGRLEVQE